MKTTEQNNRMIAEFMGGKFYGQTQFIINKNEVWLPFHGVCRLDTNGKRVSYHTSWNWLMPVVEKIESLEDENRCAKYNFNCVQSFVEIIDNETSEEIIEIDLDNKFDSTYQAIVQFIEWYNKQN